MAIAFLGAMFLRLDHEYALGSHPAIAELQQTIPDMSR